jgi:hypothetical protein
MFPCTFFITLTCKQPTEFIVFGKQILIYKKHKVEKKWQRTGVVYQVVIEFDLRAILEHQLEGFHGSGRCLLM